MSGASPRIHGLTAFTIGGTSDAVNAELVVEEDLGVAEGVSGQRFQLRRRPVVPADPPPLVHVSGPNGWEEWTEVQDFAASGPGDRHFVVDAVAGEIVLGPGVRMPDGTLRRFGAVPPKGEHVRVQGYWTGGGQRGNVAGASISVLKSSIPYVARVENRRAAHSGVDGEDIENAKVRGPIVLRTRGRAVTAEDYEHLAREAAPEVARVRCVAAHDPAEAGGVRVLLVPAAPGDSWRLRFEQLLPSEETLQKVIRRLDETRIVGSRVLVEPPVYRGVTIVAKIRARPRTNADRLEQAALDQLYHYFHPIAGGPDGDGWPFGRPVQVGEVFAALQRLPGTELVEDVRVFGADPVTGKRGQATQRLDVEPNALVFSYEHQVLVEAA